MHGSPKNHVWMFFVGLLVVVVLAGTVYAGPLRSWSNKFNPAVRFALLANVNNGNGAVLDAVLDKETQLVWERSPGNPASDWDTAQDNCYNTLVGDRMGWRLPTIEELASLVDLSRISPSPKVPSGVFTGVQLATYWSATTHPFVADSAYGVSFNTGDVNINGKTSLGVRVWCVRGQQGHDGGH